MPIGVLVDEMEGARRDAERSCDTEWREAATEVAARDAPGVFEQLISSGASRFAMSIIMAGRLRRIPPTRTARPTASRGSAPPTAA